MPPRKALVKSALEIHRALSIIEPSSSYRTTVLIVPPNGIIRTAVGIVNTVNAYSAFPDEPDIAAIVLRVIRVILESPFGDT